MPARTAVTISSLRKWHKQQADQARLKLGSRPDLLERFERGYYLGTAHAHELTLKGLRRTAREANKSDAR